MICFMIRSYVDCGHLQSGKQHQRGSHYGNSSWSPNLCYEYITSEQRGRKHMLQLLEKCNLYRSGDEWLGLKMKRLRDCSEDMSNRS